VERVTIRYASWDLSQVHLVDALTEKVLCRLYPLDKERNASGLRRPLEPLASPAPAPAAGLPPLLAQLLSRQAATRLAPAYLPKDEGDDP
jgi:putative transposase